MCGELYYVRPEGATGTLMAGVSRSGVGIDGCEADGSATVPYTGVLGDETILLLEGEVHVRNDETGEEYDFKAGDLIGLSQGLRQTGAGDDRLRDPPRYGADHIARLPRGRHPSGVGPLRCRCARVRGPGASGRPTHRSNAHRPKATLR